jgi:hypothetical protein
MGVERYRVMVSAVVEVEDPDALLSLARQRYVGGAPPDDVDMFLPGCAAALEHVLDPAALTNDLHGVAFMRGTVAAAPLQPEDE